MAWSATKEYLNSAWVNKAVLVTDSSHFHHGEKCVVLGFETIGLLQKLAMRVKNQFGEEFFLFHENQIKML